MLAVDRLDEAATAEYNSVCGFPDHAVFDNGIRQVLGNVQPFCIAVYTRSPGMRERWQANRELVRIVGELRHGHKSDLLYKATLMMTEFNDDVIFLLPDLQLGFSARLLSMSSMQECAACIRACLRRQLEDLVPYAVIDSVTRSWSRCSQFLPVARSRFRRSACHGRSGNNVPFEAAPFDIDLCPALRSRVALLKCGSRISRSMKRGSDKLERWK